MKSTNSQARLTVLATLALAVFFAPFRAQAHCDGLDGPVVKAAQKALAEGNVNLVLVWVQRADETEIKRVFDQTIAVRKLSPAARELADMYFFETLVRIHRTGEGAPYTGLKPAGRDLGPAIPAGDKALETGDLNPVVKLLSETMEHGLREHFAAAVAKRKSARNDVEAGREAVEAYVAYIHYVEGIYQAVSSAAHGHFAETEETPASEHKHGGM
jgi:hypothetical protein